MELRVRIGSTERRYMAVTAHGRYKKWKSDRRPESTRDPDPSRFDGDVRGSKNIDREEKKIGDAGKTSKII